MPPFLPSSRNTNFVPFTSTDLVGALSKLILIAFLPLFARLDNSREGLLLE